jgi:hypothetical protein
MRVARTSTDSQEDHSFLLATLTDIAGLWRRTGSLAAYQVIVSALDSNDDEVRRLAEESLNRCSPRPATHRANSDNLTLGKDKRWKESA